MMNGGGTPALLLRLSEIFACLLSFSITFLFSVAFPSLGLFTSFCVLTLSYTQNCHDFHSWRDERHDYDDITVMSHEYDDARTQRPLSRGGARHGLGTGLVG